ncbi:hypothetical protein DAETH_39240 (plasmid) [Deinococcus aetherius]|uniref:TVP38/TMEM64 family membrane protein n=1 Tax=Deinococcus aetherius TaxID=200252 RepID=A0ABM8AJG6_9DEIO|nr:hypothetical protein [Deinococcus aetherius]BDP43955.1 hypothetical protein DAETH_39240 [Deinococcus aetherius]
MSTLLTLLGVAVAVVRPEWLTGALEGAVREAGTAPLVYTLLCALAAPFHLNGVLVALSSVIWPLPVALTLSFVGSLLGSVLTAGLLARLGGAAPSPGNGWPAWFRRLSAGVARRPLVVGVLARAALGTGMALEAFFVLTGYTRRQYLLVTTLGLLVWVTQALVGVMVLHELFRVSPGLAVLAALAPLLVVALAVRLRRVR